METIKFTPIHKPTLWGGEDWLISAVGGSESVALNGKHAGRPLPDIVAEEREGLMGDGPWARFGPSFPLLVKFIDARQDLSIQVHPDDDMARRLHGKFGKNEMWYVVDALRGACLIDGFSKPLAEADYAQAVADGSIEDYLNKVPVAAGDVFYIPAGRVHGIGGGTYIAEIQQSSDVTYRLYDYNRRDSRGNLRELHTELARQAIRFGETTPDPRAHYTERPGEPAEIVRSPFFTTTLLRPTGPTARDYSGVDSFKILMTLDGSCCLTGPDGATVVLHPHEAALVPASTKSLTLNPDGRAKLLESHL